MSYAVDNEEVAFEVDSHLGLVVEAIHQAIKGLESVLAVLVIVGKIGLCVGSDLIERHYPIVGGQHL